MVSVRSVTQSAGQGVIIARVTRREPEALSRCRQLSGNAIARDQYRAGSNRGERYRIDAYRCAEQQTGDTVGTGAHQAGDINRHLRRHVR
jgi:hypothetical protein